MDYRSGRPFPLEAVKNLPEALNGPIAVFGSSTRNDAKVILTVLKYNGNNFIVTLEARNSITNRSLDADINSVLSVYSKDAKYGILKWIAGGKLRYSDYKKNEGLYRDAMGQFHYRRVPRYYCKTQV